MTWRDRILHDGLDRDGWLAARHPVIGASDAAKLAKESSVESVLRAKLSRREWHGNDYTASGYRWEPMMLAWAGIPANTALVHAPDNPGFAATPDGVLDIDGDRLVLAECKAKHGLIVNGPSLPEWRQLAWQFICLPEARKIEFIWVELVNGDIRAGRDDEPRSLTVHRSNPMILDLTAQLIPLATDLHARLTAALEFERTLA